MPHNDHLPNLELNEFREKIARLLKASLFLTMVIGGSSLTYLAACRGEYTWLDALYMSVITVSTVGYQEVFPIDTPMLRALTIFLITTGTGGLLYFASLVTAMIVEGDINHWITRRNVQRSIDGLKGHTIVCGIGSTGRHTARELVASGQHFVIVERDQTQVELLEHQLGQHLLWVQGDASDDEVLEAAGIARANGVVCALTSDRDNLFVVVTARKLNPNLRIVSRVIDERSAIKLKRAGADEVVSPNRIGGRQLAQQMIRPEMVSFLDLMMQETDQVMRIARIDISAESVYSGRALRDTDLRSRWGLIVVGVRDESGERTEYAPGPDYVLRAGTGLIAFGEASRLAEARRELHGPDPA